MSNHRGITAKMKRAATSAATARASLSFLPLRRKNRPSRIDAAGAGQLSVRGHVYLFEFKVVEMAPPGSAFAQLQERGYKSQVPRPGASRSTLIGWSSTARRPTSRRPRWRTADEPRSEDRAVSLVEGARRIGCPTHTRNAAPNRT